jgi:TonB-dependent receptor
MTIKKMALAVLAASTGIWAGQLAAQSATQGATVAQSSTGSISGKVQNEQTGALLEGARLRLAELGRETVAGREGAFSFARVPPGSYTLVVNYVGVASRTMTLEVSAGGTARLDVGLRAETGALEEILVTARIAGHGETLSIQRNAPTYRTVVSADALGQIREGNIGDALVRLPAVSVETRAGVQRTATIRGLAPQYNTVTIDGLRMTNVDGNRDIALDSFPINLLGRVEVVKANTPDLPADAIGGTLNLITRSAFDKDEPIVELELGGTYNDVRENWNQQAQVALGKRLGADETFGVFASLSYFHDERGYDTVESAYTVSAQNLFTLNRALYYDRYEIKDRIGAGVAFDYRPTDTDKYFFKVLYNYDYRDLNHYGTDWRPNPANVTSRQGSTVATTGGRVDSFAFYREPKNVFEMYIVGGENQLGDWTADYRTAWSQAEKGYPETIQIVNSFNGVNLTYDTSQRDFPAFQITNGVDINNPANLAFRQVQVTQVPRVEDEWSYDANLAKDFFGAGGSQWNLKFGARITTKDAAQAQPATNRFATLTGNTAAQLLEYHSTPGFMGEAAGHQRLLGFYPDWQRYQALIDQGTGLTRNAGDNLFVAQTIPSAEFDISEDIYGAYSQLTVDFDRLQVLLGLRWEETEINSRANRVVSNATQVLAVTPVNASSSYSELLPGLHLRYSAGENLQFRGAITKALSRPPPADLIPSVQENAQLNQRIIGNPDLKPAESVNLDVSAEYYFSAAGVLSAALFHKDIENFVFSSSRFAADGVDERTRANGDGGKLLGLELVWNQQFTALPAPFDGLGVEANYTWLDSEGKYPGRTDELTFVNAPDYIFNGILSYARGALDLRLSYNQMPDRLESVGGRQALDRYNAASDIVDFALRYDLKENYRLFLNVKNLTDEPVVAFQGTREAPVAVTYFGTQYNFGVQYQF